MTDWAFDAWPAITPKWHDGAALGEYDRLEFHVDLGCGTVKKGRIGIDHFAARGVNIVMDLDALVVESMASGPGEDAPPPGGEAYMRSRSHTPNPPCVKAVWYGLPFETSSIESIITHHCLEHIGAGFIPLMDDIYRVLKPGGIFRAITPLFPSTSAVADPDHCRYFMEDTWLSFEGHLGDENNPTGSWLDSFSVPYTKARFKKLDLDVTPRCEPEKHWTNEDVREVRVALEAVK